MHPHPHPTKSTPLERLAVAAVTVILLFLASGLGQCGAAVADDRRVETRTLDEQTTILARFLVGESGAHVPDYAALLHTMRRRLETLRRPWTCPYSRTRALARRGSARSTPRPRTSPAASPTRAVTRPHTSARSATWRVGSPRGSARTAA
jgi:hypothetical protein